MIKYNIKELIAEKSFKENKAITINEVAKEIGISRSTLSKIANSKGNYSTRTEYIEKLCNYFKCSPDKLFQIYPDKKNI